MKRITLLFFALLLLSCSSNDDAPADAGYMKVYAISGGNGPHFLQYGTENPGDQISTPISDEVHAYYFEKFNEAHPGKPRWRGMITED